MHFKFDSAQELGSIFMHDPAIRVDLKLQARESGHRPEAHVPKMWTVSWLGGGGFLKYQQGRQDGSLNLKHK